MQNSKNISAYHIAATYTGTVVGAGFASGQEILQFFATHGLDGFKGIFLAGLLFILFGYIMIELGRKYSVHSHQVLIRKILGTRTSILVNVIITSFLFLTLTAMFAGSGAIFNEYFHIAAFPGTVFMALATLVTIYLGLDFLIRAISAVVPFLLAGILGITLLAIFDISTHPLVGLHHIPLPEVNPPVPSWPLSALAYTSYNLILALAVLAPLGSRVRDRKIIEQGVLLGGLILGTGAAAIMLALYLNFPEASNYEIPMLFAAGHYASLIHILYTLVLLTEIYSTAIGNLYGLTSHLISRQKYSRNKILIAVTAAALILSQLGFSRLVHYCYPAAGLAGFLLLAGLTAEIKKHIKVII